MRFVGRSFRVLVGTFLLWCGGALLLTGAEGLRTELRYRDEARLIRAEVTGKSISRATADRGTQYELTYRADLPDAGRVQRTATVDVAEWEAVDAGSPIDVRYLPGDPDSLRLARAPALAGHIVPVAIGGVLAPIGLILLALGVRDVRRKLRLYRHGLPAHATVLAIEPTNMRVNKKTQWRIRFRYRDRVGQEREGVSDYMAPARAHEWSAGDTGLVHVDPGQGEGVLWMDERRQAS
jgi:hypothetical protein